ncbi:hypothetical protein GOBAR_AA32201 [Gossypium barbadense]|uniref:Uncharacterized protein n=1 Tax=Gossypium barbadense TaxID=3634 RepID=A0A2P5WBP3_GOSBA|nr:hypothetical protein GOBAR_AA32201 [Gossypium barbadense]
MGEWDGLRNKEKTQNIDGGFSEDINGDTGVERINDDKVSREICDLGVDFMIDDIGLDIRGCHSRLWLCSNSKGGEF